MSDHTIQTKINGNVVKKTVAARKTLADFLRVDCSLTGTHIGCEHGVCGACTVMVDGVAVRSCLMLAVQADGAEIRTVEGVAKEDGTLHRVQQAKRGWQRVDAHQIYNNGRLQRHDGAAKAPIYEVVESLVRLRPQQRREGQERGGNAVHAHRRLQEH